MNARALCSLILVGSLSIACGGGDTSDGAPADDGAGGTSGVAGAGGSSAGTTAANGGTAGHGSGGAASGHAGAPAGGTSAAGQSGAGNGGSLSAGTTGSAGKGGAAGGTSGAAGAGAAGTTGGAGAATGPAGPGRGFPVAGPWVSFYGEAKTVDLAKMGNTFRVINIDADPFQGAFSKAEIATLKKGGQNRVISYLNVGACEQYREYWSKVPSGFVSCNANKAAKLGAYDGYPDEQWMNLGNVDYQRLIVEHVAPILAAQGADGFFLDNMEIVEHGTNTTNGPCDKKCAQGGLDLVRKLREAFPSHLIVMQNESGDVTRLGTTGGVAYPTLLDGVSHEEVYAPAYDAQAEKEMIAWSKMGLMPGGRPFWLATEDYVGGCGNTASAKKVYDKSKSHGFSPYASDASAAMQVICYWPF